MLKNILLGSGLVFGGAAALFGVTRAANELNDYVKVYQDGRIKVRETLSLSPGLFPQVVYFERNPKTLVFDLGKWKLGTKLGEVKKFYYFKDVLIELIDVDGKPGVDAVQINDKLYIRNKENKALFEKADKRWKEFWDKLGIEKVLEYSEHYFEPENQADRL